MNNYWMTRIEPVSSRCGIILMCCLDFNVFLRYIYSWEILVFCFLKVFVWLLIRSCGLTKWTFSPSLHFGRSLEKLDHYFSEWVVELTDGDIKSWAFLCQEAFNYWFNFLPHCLCRFIVFYDSDRLNMFRNFSLSWKCEQYAGNDGLTLLLWWNLLCCFLFPFVQILSSFLSSQRFLNSIF